MTALAASAMGWQPPFWLAQRPWRRALAWLALLAPFFYLSYGVANHLAAARATVPSLVFEWEHQIPFVAWTIFPYWSLNVFYGLSLFLARNRHELNRHGARLLTAQCVAVLCFVIAPLQFSFGQPPAHGAAGLLFDALRGFDKPFNQAPSLHIALVVILWDLYRRVLTGRWARALLHVWSLAICVSVLTTYQHHFIDIPTGALLGTLCVWAWPLERRLSMWRAWRWTPDLRRRSLAARYAVGALAVAAVAVTLLFGNLAVGASVAASATPVGAAAAAGHTLAWGGWLLWPAASLLLVSLNYLGLGARGFQMDAQGRMAWPARVLLAPYRLGALINARLWTLRLPPLHVVWPGVALSGLSRLPSALGFGPCTVVSLCAELQVPAQANTVCLPWLDLVPATPRALRQAALRIEQAQRRGDTVVVACALGFSRSAAALVCWLVLQGHMPSVEAALAHLRGVHPHLVLGPDWLLALRKAVG